MAGPSVNVARRIVNSSFLGGVFEVVRVALPVVVSDMLRLRRTIVGTGRMRIRDEFE